MRNVVAHMFGDGRLTWTIAHQGAEDDVVKVSFPFTSRHQPYQDREALEKAASLVRRGKVPWLTPGRRAWRVDLGELKKSVDNFEAMDWLQGEVLIQPEVEHDQRLVFDRPEYKATVALYLSSEVSSDTTVATTAVPVEIDDSIVRFSEDHPDPINAAFVMMQFGNTRVHEEIAEAIKTVLGEHGIAGVRADDKRYHDDLYYNILTYLHGCGFGIAVFERIEAEKFNPNVALEVGYMFALKKPVCLLEPVSKPHEVAPANKRAGEGEQGHMHDRVAFPSNA